jgi:hypothetical protein
VVVDCRDHHYRDHVVGGQKLVGSPIAPAVPDRANHTPGSGHSHPDDAAADTAVETACRFCFETADKMKSFALSNGELSGNLRCYRRYKPYRHRVGVSLVS